MDNDLTDIQKDVILEGLSNELEYLIRDFAYLEKKEIRRFIVKILDDYTILRDHLKF